MNPTTTTFVEHPKINGLEQQLEELFKAARPDLIRFALARGVSADGVEDVVQETLLEAWRHLDQLRAIERLEAWLRGICRNVCLRWRSMQTQQQPLSFYQNANRLCLHSLDGCPEHVLFCWFLYCYPATSQ